MNISISPMLTLDKRNTKFVCGEGLWMKLRLLYSAGRDPAVKVLQSGRCVSATVKGLVINAH
jgi:hypothetical protein